MRNDGSTMLAKYALALTALLLPASIIAQTTHKTIQIIVPFAPGASADGIGRIIGAELGQRLGRQVVVENKAGAGGSLGLVIVAKAAPDGDILAIGAPGALVINPHLPNPTPIDPLRDLVPIARLVATVAKVVGLVMSCPVTVMTPLWRSTW